MLELQVVLLHVGQLFSTFYREAVDARRRVGRVEVRKAGERERRFGCGVIGGAVWNRAGEGDAVALLGGVVDTAPKGDLLAELVVDAAPVEEVVDAVAAAQDRFACSGEVVGEAEAWGVVAVVVVDDGARNAVDTGELDVAIGRIDGGLAVVHFGGPGDEAIAEAEVQGEPLSGVPVVFKVAADLVVARTVEAVLRADAVVVGEPGKHFSGDEAGGVTGAEVEVALAGDGTEVGYIAPDAGAAELDSVFAAHDGDRVGELVGIFGHFVGAVVAGVVDGVAIAADQRAATEVRVAVGVDDAEVGRDRGAGEYRNVGKGVAVIAGAELINDVGREGVIFAERIASSVDEVLPGGETGGQVRQLRGAGEVAVVVGEAEECAIVLAEVGIGTHVEAVCLGVVDAGGGVVVLGSVDGAGGIGQREGIEVVEACLVEAVGRNDVAGVGGADAGRGLGVIDDARRGGRGCVWSIGIKVGAELVGGRGGRGGSQDLREVAGTHQRGRDGDSLGVQGLVLALALVVAEEEDVVLPERAAERAAEGVAPEGERAGGLHADEPVVRVGVKQAGAGELEGRAMDLVGA